jgi:hypothetical protein
MLTCFGGNDLTKAYNKGSKNLEDCSNNSDAASSIMSDIHNTMTLSQSKPLAGLAASSFEEF